ncbi:MAG: KEOPS complex subunit Pcc1 [Candidatus Hadarchaeales archaeon]
MRERDRKTSGRRNKVSPLQLEDAAESTSEGLKKNKSRSSPGEVTHRNRGAAKDRSSSERAKARVEFTFESARRAEAVKAALIPEENASRSEKVTISRKKNVLCLEVEAKHTAALRAVLNSFIRLVMVVDEITKTGGK